MIKELIAEMINAAYENGYEAEIKDLSDEDLAYDMWSSLDEEFQLQDVLAAVKEARGVH